MTHLVKKLSKTILFVVLPLVVLVGIFSLPDAVNATVQSDCTDAGSDGITDHVIIVGTSGTSCIVDGTDDQIQIQWAIDNSISGDTVFLNSATYDIRTGISRTIGDWTDVYNVMRDAIPLNWGLFIESKNNITIRGLGATTTILNASDYPVNNSDPAATDFFFGVSNSTKITIKDMKLQSMQTTWGTYKKNYNPDASSGTYSTGSIYVWNTSYSNFTNLNMTGGSGVYGSGSHYNTYSNNIQICETCYDIGGSSMMGTSSSHNTYLNNTITVRNNGAFGIRLEGASTYSDIIGNTVFGSDQIITPIELYSASDNNNIINNTIIGNNAKHGITVLDSNYNLIEGNIVSGTRDDTIRISSNGGSTNTNNSIIGNLLYNLGTPYIGEAWGDAVGGIAITWTSVGNFTLNNCLIDGNTIVNTYYGIMINERVNGSCIIKNNIIINQSHVGIFKDSSSSMIVTSSYNDLWNNILGNYNGLSSGTGDISSNPLFASSTDFHLQSQAGRWNGSTWVTDSQTSPAIDAGDPASAYSNEPFPNGSRINLGAYGNTIEASKSSGAPVPTPTPTLTPTPTPSITPTPTPSPQGGLVGYWKFDETSGTTANDSSGNSNNGTINGATRTTGKVNNALSFDGSNDNVDAGNQDSLKNISSAITIEMWFNFTLNAYEGLFWHGGKTFLMLRPSNGDSYVYLTGVANHNWTAAPYNLNQWYHYVVTYDSAGGTDNTKIYRDGQIIKTFTDTGTLAQATGNLFIGYAGSYFMNGFIDEVRVYNRALSASEVLAGYNAGNPSAFSPADLNSDNLVNSVDFGILMSNWNSTAKPKADINQDGTVNSVDFGIMMSAWG